MHDAYVSVVIPCFNAESHLEEAIKSVQEQTYPRIELILVDDGSTDDTRAIIEQHADEAIIHYGPNRGASAARMKGTELANGDYIQYLDADDVLHPCAIEERVGALKRADADVAYSGYQRLVQGDDGRFRPGSEKMLQLEDVHQDPEIATFTGFWVPPVALTYRQSLVERIGGWHEKLSTGEDARFLQDAAHHEAEFVHVPSVLGKYRVHQDGSLSTRDPVGFRLDCLRNAKEIEQRWRDRQGGITREQRQALCEIYRGLAENFFWDRSEAFRGAINAFTRVYRGKPSYRLRTYRLIRKWLGAHWAATVLSPARHLYHVLKGDWHDWYY